MLAVSNVLENKTGCRFLTVDAYAAAVPFYEKNGFVESLQEASERKQKKNRETILMHKDLFND